MRTGRIRTVWLLSPVRLHALHFRPYLRNFAPILGWPRALRCAVTSRFREGLDLAQCTALHAHARACRVPDGAQRRRAVYLPRRACGGRDPCGSLRRLVHEEAAEGITPVLRLPLVGSQARAKTRWLLQHIGVYVPAWCQAAKTDLRRRLSDPLSGLLRRHSSFLFRPQPTQAESGPVVGMEVRAQHKLSC